MRLSPDRTVNSAVFSADALGGDGQREHRTCARVQPEDEQKSPSWLRWTSDVCGVQS